MLVWLMYSIASVPPIFVANQRIPFDTPISNATFRAQIVDVLRTKLPLSVPNVHVWRDGLQNPSCYEGKHHTTKRGASRRDIVPSDAGCVLSRCTRKI